MIGIVFKDSTKAVDLRHFFMPQEGFPRFIKSNMRKLDCDDNPVTAFFPQKMTNSVRSATVKLPAVWLEPMVDQ